MPVVVESERKFIVFVYQEGNANRDGICKDLVATTNWWTVSEGRFMNMYWHASHLLSV